MNKADVLNMSTDEMIEEIIRRGKVDLDAITVIKGNSRYLDDIDDVPVTTRLEAVLLMSGEASRQESFFDEGQSLLVVSDRVINWAIAVLAREKGGTEEAFTQIYGQLANQKEENQWHWLRQRLPDAAIESLIKKLEKENGE